MDFQSAFKETLFFSLTLLQKLHDQTLRSFIKGLCIKDCNQLTYTTGLA